MTTAEELEAFAEISRIVREKHPDAPLHYRDAKNYFTVHQKNLRKWFVRLAIEKQPFWVAFRHVKPEAARTLCPGVEVIDAGAFGDCRIALKSAADVEKLGPIILASFEVESARVADATEVPEPDVAP